MRVVSKQRNSKMCFICGMENPIGLKAQFYNMEDGSVVTPIKYLPEHQSFTNRVHGGISVATLDELSMRAYWVTNENGFGVTTSMSVKYRKPVPYNVEIIGRGIIESDTSRFLKAHAMILDKDGNVYTEAEVNYIKMPVEKIVKDIDFHDEMAYLIEDNIKEIDFNLLKK